MLQLLLTGRPISSILEISYFNDLLYVDINKKMTNKQTETF